MRTSNETVQEGILLLAAAGIDEALSYDIGYSRELGPDGTPHGVLSEDFGNGVYQVHAYVDRVRECELPAFVFQATKKGLRIPTPTTVGRLPPRHLLTDDFLQRYDFSPQVKAFVECYDQVADSLGCQIGASHLPSGRQAGELMADVANELVGLLRAKTRSQEFRTALGVQLQRAERNFSDGKALINALRERRVRLNVVRVDLSYRRASRPTLNQAKRDMRRLFNNCRSNAIFANLEGCIWRLEYRVRTGYHFHVIFFFDGSERRDDGVIAAQICKYWERDVTRGRGRSENCNYSKNKYKALGIGRIDSKDYAKHYFLLHAVLGYLVKADEAVRPLGVKAFGVSRPKPPSGRGRKRSTEGFDVALWEEEGRVGGRLFDQLPSWAKSRVKLRDEREHRRMKQQRARVRGLPSAVGKPKKK